MCPLSSPPLPIEILTAHQHYCIITTNKCHTSPQLAKQMYRTSCKLEGRLSFAKTTNSLIHGAAPGCANLCHHVNIVPPSSYRITRIRHFMHYFACIGHLRMLHCTNNTTMLLLCCFSVVSPHILPGKRNRYLSSNSNTQLGHGVLYVLADTAPLSILIAFPFPINAFHDKPGVSHVRWCI